MYIPKVWDIVYVKDLKMIWVVTCFRDWTPVKWEIAYWLSHDRPTPQYVVRSKLLNPSQYITWDITDLEAWYITHIKSSKQLRELLLS